jgi:hypothetical protein
MISPALDRIYSNDKDDKAKNLLNMLTDEKISTAGYRDAMFNIGLHLGNILLESIDIQKKYCVVATVEDADFLAKGIIEAISKKVAGVYLACLWNERTIVNGQSIAPIYNKFFDKEYETADELIVVKSIIAGSCVVKTNITALYSTVKPSIIHVVAPVMHASSEEKLEKEFSSAISKLFKYTFLAKDSCKTEDGNIFPGIGGNVYTKLGFKSQSYKNSTIPDIVADRLFA